MNAERKIVIQTSQLTKLYGNGNVVRALDGVNLTVYQGEFIAIIGPSGSGKSTLLNMIGALDKPTQGEVMINGQPLSKVRNIDHFRGKTVGFVFQTHNLIPTLTARENVEVPIVSYGLSPRRRKERARFLLELVGLAKRENFLPNQMSGGERQRVAVARALANEPSIILADEPTGNLDSQNTLEILHLLSQLNQQQGVTLIVVTHNHEVARATQRVITIRDGKIQSDIPIHSAFDSDLLDLKSSSLGQAIINGQVIPAELEDVAPRLKEILQQI
jgi:ABC-type lipoprotein export system ATPase subunit